MAGRYLGELARLRPTAGAIAGDIAGDAEAAFRRSREIVGTEIEVFSNKAETTISHSGDNIHIEQTGSGTVVAMQQGDHSTATVRQNVDTAGLETLRSALESLLEKFGDHEQLAPLIKQTKVEATKPQPLLGRIRNLLNEIKMWIGLVKEGKELFETAENAAVQCGMEVLPGSVRISHFYIC